MHVAMDDNEKYVLPKFYKAKHLIMQYIVSSHISTASSGTSTFTIGAEVILMQPKFI